MLKTKVGGAIITLVVVLGALAYAGLLPIPGQNEGDNDGVRIVVTWERIKPDHIIYDVDGSATVVEPVPGKQSDQWRTYLPYVEGQSYGVGVYINYAAPDTPHLYTCAIYVRGALVDSGMARGVGSIRCRYPEG